MVGLYTTNGRNCKMVGLCTTEYELPYIVTTHNTGYGRAGLLDVTLLEGARLQDGMSIH